MILACALPREGIISTSELASEFQKFKFDEMKYCSFVSMNMYFEPATCNTKKLITGKKVMYKCSQIVIT